MEYTTYSHTVLIIEDDEDIAEILKYNFVKEGFKVTVTSKSVEALGLIKKHKPQLIILDVMLSEMDGISLCQEIRSSTEVIQPIIVLLTARGEEYSQIAGYKAGADDYIVKPISPRILVSKINALLRRIEPNAFEETEITSIKIRDVEIDTESFLIIREGKSYPLTKKELEFILLLLNKRDKVVSREQIFNQIWGSDSSISDRNIDVQIRRLRTKIGEDIIKTVKGVGYKLVGNN